MVIHTLLSFLGTALIWCSSLAVAGPNQPSALPPFSVREFVEVKTGSSPDNSFGLVTDMIRSGRKEIRMAAYMLRSPGITEALAEAAKRRVKVTILLDGWTVGRPAVEKVDPHELYMAREVVKAGGKVFYLRSATGSRTDRRFRYLHAKYLVVDDQLFISSENFANNGFSPSSSLGSRGWVIAIRNRALAANYAKIFDKDLARVPGFSDIVAYGKHPDYTLADPDFIPTSEPREGDYRPNRGAVVKEVMHLERVVSPDDSLAVNRAILGAIRGAKRSLQIQSLSFSPHWGANGGSPEANPSPLAEEVLNAARRGLKIRVMLNPPYFFNKPKKNPDQEEEMDEEKAEFWQELASGWENLTLVNLPFALTLPTGSSSSSTSTKDNKALLEYFRETARKERLDLEASFFYVNENSLRILHNKGMIVDGQKTLVSSINWTENSLKNNREAAVIVESRAVASYYTKLFEIDWKYFRNRK